MTLTLNFSCCKLDDLLSKIFSAKYGFICDSPTDGTQSEAFYKAISESFHSHFLFLSAAKPTAINHNSALGLNGTQYDFPMKHLFAFLCSLKRKRGGQEALELKTEDSLTLRELSVHQMK